MSGKLSVLIAAYRAERWLGECLSSAQRQVLPEGWRMEILVGVDGCPGTLDAVRKLNEVPVKIISLKENSGPYVTFNTLMRFATGDAICRFDADDVMRQGYLSEQLQVLGQGADMTMAWSILTDADLRPTSQVLAHPELHVPRGERRRGAEGQFMIRREVWDTLGGFLPWRCSADTDFFERVLACGFSVKVIEKFLYFRRIHQDSLTAHPGTNFQSDIRKHYMETMARYAQEYHLLARPAKIDPVQAEVLEVFD